MNLQPLVDQASARLKDVEHSLATFDFGAVGNDPKAYEGLSREHQRLTRLVELWDSLQQHTRELDDSRGMLEAEEDDELIEVINDEIETLEEAVAREDRDIKALLLPSNPNEGRPIIIEIRPAAGGDEAGLFAGDLCRMYMRFAEERGWRCEVLSRSESALGGIKEAAFSLRGGDAYQCMCYESGVHRVQRVPVTESGGRIHTSTVTVAVLPEAEEVDIEINPDDLRMDVYRSSGPGGQCVNTTDSAVRITHLPTGLSVACQQEKSQHRNRETAMRILRSRLLKAKQAEEDAKSAAERRQQVGTGDRSERIRTYNYPQSRVTDHRFGITLYDLPSIMEGSIADLVAEIVAIDVERRLEAELN